jgi:hypothetical protein
MSTKVSNMTKGQTNICLPTGVASFPKLFVPEALMEGKAPVYSITILWDKSADLSALEQAIKNAEEKKFPPNDAGESTVPAGLRSPIKDGDLKISKKTGKVRPEYAGKYFIQTTCKEDEAPKVVDGRLEKIIDKKQIYGGMLANVYVNAFTYDNSGNRGTSLYLQHVQKSGDGETFGAAVVAPEDVFDVID